MSVLRCLAQRQVKEYNLKGGVYTMCRFSGGKASEEVGEKVTHRRVPMPSTSTKEIFIEIARRALWSISCQYGMGPMVCLCVWLCAFFLKKGIEIEGVLGRCMSIYFGKQMIEMMVVTCTPITL